MTYEVRSGRGWAPLDGEPSPELADLLTRWQSAGAEWDEDAGEWIASGSEDADEVRESS